MLSPPVPVPILGTSAEDGMPEAMAAPWTIWWRLNQTNLQFLYTHSGVRVLE